MYNLSGKNRHVWVGHDVAMLVIAFLFALLLILVPLPAWGKEIWPQWMGVFVIGWCLWRCELFGVIGAWCVGLIQDIVTGSTLGIHALSLTVLAFTVLRLQRKFYIFRYWQQVICVLMLFVLESVIRIGLYGMVGVPVTGFIYWLSVIVSTLCWMVVWSFINRTNSALQTHRS